MHATVAIVASGFTGNTKGLSEMKAYLTHARCSVVGILLALAGCADPVPPAPMPVVSAPDPATLVAGNAEREASLVALNSCLMHAAKRLDDHKSDAATIAQAVLAACTIEFQKSTEVFSRGLAVQGKQRLVATAKNVVAGIAIQTVLENRQTGSSPAVADLTELGAEAASRGDYATALRSYRKAADQGNADAQSLLGFMYYQGQGVAQNYKEAARWYRKAADQGNVDARTLLGIMYEDGLGVPQDYREAARCYRIAADLGAAVAQSRLGDLYDFGHGVSRDFTEAARWYRKAADQGLAMAQVMLGMHYEKGQGVPKDYAEAARWYGKAADQGNADAQYFLGATYFLGQGVPKDYVQAYMWLNLAAIGRV